MCILTSGRTRVGRVALKFKSVAISGLITQLAAWYFGEIRSHSTFNHDNFLCVKFLNIVYENIKNVALLDKQS